MTLPKLFRIEELADQLGVPRAPLLQQARDLGYLIEIGSAKRIKADEVGEFLELCRVTQKAPGSTFVKGPGKNPSTSSAKPDAQTSTRARQTFDTLKKPSPDTSQPPASVSTFPGRPTPQK